MISLKTLGGVAAVCLGFASIACGGADAGAESSADAITAKAQPISSAALAKTCGQKNLALSTCKTISSTTSAPLDAAQTKKVEDVINQSTESWGDSIYEGEVDGNEEGLKYVATKLVKKSDGSLLGYKVRFSFVGWETSCAEKKGYDRANAKGVALLGCKMGRIYQTIVVGTDLSPNDYDIIADAELILDSAS
jgi:hypothetical protein